jgi:ribose transport system permease protein
MLILGILFNRTVTGRRILATGVNAKAADYAGIDSGSTIRLAHGLSGLLAGLAAVLTISKLGAAQTSIGSTWLLVSFAAPILGGTLLSGGKVSIVGTFLGAALMMIITNALVLFGVSSYWFQAFTGGILLFAFAINKIRITMNTSEGRVLIEGGK